LLRRNNLLIFNTFAINFDSESWRFSRDLPIFADFVGGIGDPALYQIRAGKTFPPLSSVRKAQREHNPVKKLPDRDAAG
jgi:hypothetical protein